MLCINCAQLRASQHQTQSSGHGPALQSDPPRPLVCSRCGAMMTDAAFREQFIAKVRQLEQFGLGIEPPSTADSPHS